MQKTLISLLLFFSLLKSTLATIPLPNVTGSPERAHTTIKLQPPADIKATNLATTSLTEYPLDPYQMRVPGTTTSLIFSKYGPPIHWAAFLELVARAQYAIVGEVVSAHGDGPVPRTNVEWSEKRLCVAMSRPLAREDLTWLMLADMLEGARGFFAVQGWFETSVTILDDTAGPVGDGRIFYR